MRTRLGTLLTAVSLVAAPTSAVGQAEPAPERVLVLDLAATGVEASLARSLSEVLASAIRRAMPGVAVIGQSEINSMLALEKQKDLLGCEEDIACLAEIGGALGADRLATGSVGKVGELHLLNLKLIDSQKATTIRHVSKEVPGAVDLLVEATRQWGAHLVDPTRAGEIGYVNILGSGAVLVDGEPRGDAPLDRLPVASGNRRIVWRNGDEEVERVVRVAPYAVADVAPVDPQLAEPAAESQPPAAGRTHPSLHFGGVGFLSKPDNAAGGSFAGTGPAVGGRLAYLTDLGVLPYIGFEMRLFFIGDSASLTEWVGQLGLGYRTSGRLSVMPSLGLEVMRATVSDKDSGVESDEQAISVALGYDPDKGAATVFGLHAAVEVLYELSPVISAGVRAGLPIVFQPELTQFSWHGAMILQLNL